MSGIPVQTIRNKADMAKLLKLPVRSSGDDLARAMREATHYDVEAVFHTRHEHDLIDAPWEIEVDRSGQLRVRSGSRGYWLTAAADIPVRLAEILALNPKASRARSRRGWPDWIRGKWAPALFAA